VPGRSSGVGLAIVGVSAAVLAGGAVGLQPGIALPLGALVVGTFLLISGTVSLFDYFVAGSALMFLPGGGTLHVAASDALLPALALAVIGGRSGRRGLSLSKGAVAYALVGVAVVVLSATVATLSPSGFVMSLGLSNVLKTIVVLTFMIVTATWVCHAPIQEISRTLRIWGWTAGSLSAGSLLWMLGGPGLIPHDSLRSLGFFQDPNLYAGYLLVSLAVIMAREALAPARETTLLVVLVCGGVLATASRSAAAAMAVLLMLALITVKSRAVRWATVPVGVVGVFLAFVVLTGLAASSNLPSLERLTTSTSEVGQDPRLMLWSRALHVWESSPVIGVGIGQFGRYTVDIGGVLNTGAGYIAHNTFLSYLAETGVMGLGVWLVGFGSLVSLAWRGRAGTGDLRASLLLGLAAIALQMMTLNLQNVRYVWIYFGLVVGLAGKSRLQTALPAAVPRAQWSVQHDAAEDDVRRPARN